MISSAERPCQAHPAQHIQHSAAQHIQEKHAKAGQAVLNANRLGEPPLERRGDSKELFATGLGTEELAAEEGEARARGVTSVPTFFVAGEPIASGAQKTELLAAAFGPALGCALRS